ncbi:hypothetical protein VRU48_14035 [Pedobacter sp. KR3-3]|uniref:Lipocalin-like domain-containing protein n=1 Tax=Pedobacter albus TaxID=3113905 RepID=A0ABU7IAP8_9SPHI|nr:hypothetical protein [Pedobacter sp. KR3-3]MEE1946239.1 hypothetical protein [Pedobacter sp. KR3-3]
MKKLLLLALVCMALACKKSASDNMTKYNWTISSAVVTPAMTIDGKTSTDFLAIGNASTCLTGLTYIFNENGTFVTSSNGPLCDRAPESPSQKWTRNGNIVKLNYGGGGREAALNGDKLIIVDKSTKDNVEYTIVTTLIAKQK